MHYTVIGYKIFKMGVYLNIQHPISDIIVADTIVTDLKVSTINACRGVFAGER